MLVNGDVTPENNETFQVNITNVSNAVVVTAQGVSGPIWVRGGIPVVAADGHAYEIRNRVTLCRCGASSNKPFCDGSHASIKFSDQA